MQYYGWHTPVSYPVYVSSSIIYGLSLCVCVVFLVFFLLNLLIVISIHVHNAGVPYSLAELAICYCTLHISLLVLGLGSHFCHYFLYNLLLR